MASKIPQRKIGDDLVGAVGLGCMGMTFAYTSSGFDDGESLKVLTAAADAGVTHWDTADVYGPFTSEYLIGRWFKESGRRDEIFLATKFGFTMSATGMEINGDPAYVKKACLASLKRLQTDRIDLYYLHAVDPKVPVENTVKAMADLKTQGKIRYLGLSGCSARSLRRAHAIHPITAIQVEYSPFTLDIESDKVNLLKTARELGVKIVPYSPLGRGFLTGTITSLAEIDKTDGRHLTPRFWKENFDANLELANRINAIAKEKGITGAQLCLAWLLAQGNDILPIPGTKKVKWFEENTKAANIELTKEEEAKVREAIKSVGGAKGDPYGPELMPLVYGDSPDL